MATPFPLPELSAFERGASVLVMKMPILCKHHIRGMTGKHMGEFSPCCTLTLLELSLDGLNYLHGKEREKSPECTAC
jgi:hypothetical protein